MDPRISVIQKRMKDINRIIAVASAKGGVGKSLLTSSLSLLLVQRGLNIGLLDLDLTGPSSHIILGVNKIFPIEEKGIIPPKVHGISFMSIVYFTNDKMAPFKGTDVSNIIREILAITQWGDLDFLLIDMPPGLGDETLDVIRFIKSIEFLVATTPSKISMGAVNKLLQLLKELHIPIIGIIENMKMDKYDYVKQSIVEMKIPYLGAIKFDHNVEAAIGNPVHLMKTSFINDLRRISIEDFPQL